MIILFDGVCDLCAGVVKFILPRDRHGVFRFSALQSPYARELLARHGIPLQDPPQTLFLVEGDRLYDKSTAVIRIFRGLTAAWPLLSLFWLIPRPIRDGIYRLVARSRYRIFGRSETCLMPSAEWKSRFIQ